MSFCSHKVLLVAAAVLVYSAGARFDGHYKFPEGMEQDLIERVQVLNTKRDYLYRIDPVRIVEFMKTLTQAEGDAVTELDTSAGGIYVSRGVYSLEFKLLLAIALPDGYDRFGLPVLATFDNVKFYASFLLPLYGCAYNVELCAPIRSRLGRSDFAMAVFLLVHFGPRSDNYLRAEPEAFLSHFFNSKKTDSFEINKVEELLKYESIPHMVALVRELRDFHDLHNRKSPAQTTLLLGHVWNHLRNEATLGVDGRARRDREAAAAAADVGHPHPARVGWVAWGRGLVGHVAGIAGRALRAVGRLALDARVHGRR